MQLEYCGCDYHREFEALFAARSGPKIRQEAGPLIGRNDRIDTTENLSKTDIAQVSLVARQKRDRMLETVCPL